MGLQGLTLFFWLLTFLAKQCFFALKPHSEGDRPMSLEEIKSRIANAEAAAGRASGAVQLIAVSKVQPNARVEEVLKPSICGHPKEHG